MLKGAIQLNFNDFVEGLDDLQLVHLGRILGTGNESNIVPPEEWDKQLLKERIQLKAAYVKEFCRRSLDNERH